MSCLIEMYFYFLASDWLTTTAETYSGKLSHSQYVISNRQTADRSTYKYRRILKDCHFIDQDLSEKGSER